MIRFIKPNTYAIFFMLSLVYILAFYIQSTLFINRDVSWDLYITSLALSGGHYIKDFFDVSPPSTFYLYFFPVIMTKTFAIKTVIAFRIYVFMLTTLTLIISSFYIKKIFTKNDKLFSFLFLITILTAILILPMEEFGERDHLFFILTLPYFLAMTYRLLDGKINLVYASLTGLLAGAGFCIKPYFFISLILLELFYIVKKRNALNAIRVDTIIIMTFSLTYLAATCILYKNYITVIVPMLTALYYPSVKSPSYIVLFNINVIFCYVAMLTCFFQKKPQPYQTLSTVLMIALTGTFISYAIQQTTWYYHLIPSLSLSFCLYLVYIYCSYRTPSTSYHNFTSIILNILFFVYLYYYYYIFTMHYFSNKYLNKDMNKIISFMNTHAYGQRVNYFSTNVSIFYPIIFNAGAIPGSRFEHLVFMPELIKNNINTMNEKNFYIDTVTSDINQYNPKFIFINAIDRGTGGNKTNSYIDYISFFSQSDKFKTVWKKYHYYTTIESPGIVLKFPVFKIDVYQRG